MKIPQHVAIILDGNGRWAKAKGMPRTYGHYQGAKNVETIIQAADDLGIRYVTMYAFSTENWSRPEGEVDEIMKLLRQYLAKCVRLGKKHNMRIRLIGDIHGLSKEFQEEIADAMEQTSIYNGMNLTIAINYGSRDEITRAVKKISAKVADGSLSVDDITQEVISQNLDTWDVPDPDLLIRTSGEQRLSNYLLWQLAYAEFYFTPVPWPDFDEKELLKAIEAYSDRDRRYGKV